METGSFYVENKLISTDLLSFYINKGLKVHCVKYAMAYLGKRVLGEFADKIVNLRRQAAASGDSGSKRISLMFKLMGNRYAG